LDNLRNDNNILNKINSMLFINGDIIYDNFAGEGVLTPRPILRGLYIEFLNGC